MSLQGDEEPDDQDEENQKEDELFGQFNPRWTRVFGSLDLDGDKRCDFHEFYSATVNHEELLTDQIIKQIFKNLDHNKNGYLEIEDFTRLMPTNLNKTGKVRYQKGPFFETNSKFPPAEQQAIIKRW